MRVLVTGMTGQQSGKIPVTGYMTLAQCVVGLMRDLGHEVDFRLITVGEDLSGYDLMIFGVMSPFSVASKNIYAVLDAMARYWVTGLRPAIVLIDDWTLHQIDQNSRSSRRVVTRLVRETICSRRPGFAWATSPVGLGTMQRVMEHVTETGWPPAIFPAFGWGNHSIFKDLLMAESYWPMDITCYTPLYDTVTVPDGERRREWVLAVIQDHVPWLRHVGFDVRAPVSAPPAAGYAGDDPEEAGDASVSAAATPSADPYPPILTPRGWNLRVIGGGLTKRDRTSVMMEWDVVQEYANCWGVLSPPYPKLLGSGWWRNRFVYAALTRTVFYCDPREAPQLGEPYNLDLRAIESLTADELGQVADAQAEALWEGCWDREQLHDEARRMITEVMQG